MTLPTVSVVVVNYNGRHHLEPCFNSLIKQDYPGDRLELLLIDNASQDGSLELMAQRFPDVKIIRNQENVGFAPAVNQGARAATGQYVALINNDAYADPNWIAEMVVMAERQRDDGVVCIGAKMLDWYGDRIDFVGGGINFYGHGDQFFHRLRADAVHIQPQHVLFACGGAMLCERQVFVDTGGFDDDYFAYFEDVDFGWRLWLLGYKVMLAPDAVVYHRLHGTSGGMYWHQVSALIERNALITIIKNYGEENLQRVLPAALMLLIKKSLLDSNNAIDRREFDLRRRSEASSDPTLAVPKLALGYLVAAGDLLDDFPQVWQKREAVQQRRVRSDEEILPLFKRPMGTNYLSPAYTMLQEALTEAFNIREVFNGTRTTRVLIISSDPLGARLAGPGIRAVEMARYLASSCYVTLAAPRCADVTIPNVACVAFERDDGDTVHHLASHAEVIILQGFTLHRYPSIQQLHKVLVIDLYDPFHLENLEVHTKQQQTLERAQANAGGDLMVLNEQLQAGDCFICASERQRDFWLGALGSIGRLAPETYINDASFRSLLDVVPFGLSPTLPEHTAQVLKGVVPGVTPTDTVLLWGGGIWEWFDPLTLIRAMQQVRHTRPDIKLFFMGKHHPNTDDVPAMAMYDRAVALAKELGLHNETVFFNDHWVPYAERANYLLEADIGVSAHLEHVETRFAFRTRLLDYIWTGLPMIVSEGDTLADVVRERGLGFVVGVEDVDGWADAIFTLADRRTNQRASYAPAFEVAQQAFAWPEVLKPLIQFCQHPRYAFDKQRALQAPNNGSVQLPDTMHAGVKRRVDELEAQVAQKNQHIAYLEDLLRRIERGKVMRALNVVKRVRYGSRKR